jgi:WD40 repeat protein
LTNQVLCFSDLAQAPVIENFGYFGYFGFTIGSLGKLNLKYLKSTIRNASVFVLHRESTSPRGRIADFLSGHGTSGVCAIIPIPSSEAYNPNARNLFAMAAVDQNLRKWREIIKGQHTHSLRGSRALHADAANCREDALIKTF